MKALKGVEGAPQSLDALAERAIDAEVDRLEVEHNEGRPFPDLEGELDRVPANMAEIAAKGRATRARRRAQLAAETARLEKLRDGGEDGT